MRVKKGNTIAVVVGVCLCFTACQSGRNGTMLTWNAKYDSREKYFRDAIEDLKRYEERDISGTVTNWSAKSALNVISVVLGGYEFPPAYVCEMKTARGERYLVIVEGDVKCVGVERGWFKKRVVIVDLDTNEVKIQGAAHNGRVWWSSYSLDRSQTELGDVLVVTVTPASREKITVWKEYYVLCPIYRELILLRRTQGDVLLPLSNTKGYCNRMDVFNTEYPEIMPDMDELLKRKPLPRIIGALFSLATESDDPRFLEMRRDLVAIGTIDLLSVHSNKWVRETAVAVRNAVTNVPSVNVPK